MTAPDESSKRKADTDVTHLEEMNQEAASSESTRPMHTDSETERFYDMSGRVTLKPICEMKEHDQSDQ